MTARFAAIDEQHMRRAVALAEKGRGTTHPNPVVGAVIADGERVLATGYHERAGGPHAEIVALAALSGRAPGATLYVTLEPCCHTGRTGPCTEAILAAGIRRVVVGCRDENPKVFGRGINRLRRAGVRIEVGCLEATCRAQNRAFFRWIRDRRPHVTLKAAASLDGFIAPARTPPGTIHWLTGPPARAAAHVLRAGHDALLVGAGTVRSDDPRLTVRLPPGFASSKKQASLHLAAGGRAALAAHPTPLRVILDGALKCPPKARIFRTPGGPVLLVGAEPRKPDAAFTRRKRALAATGAEVVLLPGDRHGRIAPAKLVAMLANRQVQSLLLEGGAQVHAAFIAARLVDEVALFLAPQLLGGGVPIAAGPGLAGSVPLRLGPLRAIQIAGDILVSADVVEGRPSRDR